MSAAAFTVTVTAAAVAFFVVMAVTAACVSFTVVIALYIRVKVQLTCDECFNCSICFTHYSAVKSDTCLCQSILCTTADTAADEYFYLVCCKETAESAMAAAVSIDNLAGNNFAFFNIIHLEL
jgi:hypothetical protein